MELTPMLYQVKESGMPTKMSFVRRLGVVKRGSREFLTDTWVFASLRLGVRTLRF
jgi:hypothetical protein